MNYLNKALDSFNSNLVNPVHYIFFTSFVILASSILFEEWRSIASIDVFATLVGLSVVIIALFLISAFNDLQITLNELCHSPTRKYLNKSTTFVQRKDLPWNTYIKVAESKMFPRICSSVIRNVRNLVDRLTPTILTLLKSVFYFDSRSKNVNIFLLSTGLTIKLWRTAFGKVMRA